MKKSSSNAYLAIEAKKDEKGFTLMEIVTLGLLFIVFGAIALPKYQRLVAQKKEGQLRERLGFLRTEVMDYYTDKINAGKKPEFPTFNAQDVPKDPYHNSRELTYIYHYPIEPSDFKLDGGWIYNKLTGEVFADVKGRTEY